MDSWTLTHFSAEGWEGLHFPEPMSVGNRFVLFGENNSGKTSFARLLQLVASISIQEQWPTGKEDFGSTPNPYGQHTFASLRKDSVGDGIGSDSHFVWTSSTADTFFIKLHYARLNSDKPGVSYIGDSRRPPAWCDVTIEYTRISQERLASDFPSAPVKEPCYYPTSVTYDVDGPLISGRVIVEGPPSALHRRSGQDDYKGPSWFLTFLEGPGARGGSLVHVNANLSNIAAEGWAVSDLTPPFGLLGNKDPIAIPDLMYYDKEERVFPHLHTNRIVPVALREPLPVWAPLYPVMLRDQVDAFYSLKAAPPTLTFDVFLVTEHITFSVVTNAQYIPVLLDTSIVANFLPDNLARVRFDEVNIIEVAPWLLRALGRIEDFFAHWGDPDLPPSPDVGPPIAATFRRAMSGDIGEDQRLLKAYIKIIKRGGVIAHSAFLLDSCLKWSESKGSKQRSDSVSKKTLTSIRRVLTAWVREFPKVGFRLDKEVITTMLSDFERMYKDPAAHPIDLLNCFRLLYTDELPPENNSLWDNPDSRRLVYPYEQLTQLHALDILFMSDAFPTISTPPVLAGLSQSALRLPSLTWEESYQAALRLNPESRHSDDFSSEEVVEPFRINGLIIRRNIVTADLRQVVLTFFPLCDDMTAEGRPALSINEVGKGVLWQLGALQLAREGRTYFEHIEHYLHPKASADLAEAIVRETSYSVFETHAESILIRFQKLIKKGFLNPESVKVCVFKRVEGGAHNTTRCEVATIAINDRGDLAFPFPDGFAEVYWGDLGDA